MLQQINELSAKYIQEGDVGKSSKLNDLYINLRKELKQPVIRFDKVIPKVKYIHSLKEFKDTKWSMPVRKILANHAAKEFNEAELEYAYRLLTIIDKT